MELVRKEPKRERGWIEGVEGQSDWGELTGGQGG